MAYADIQNRVGQTQMANQILLAQSKIPPPNEGEGTRDYRKRISGGTYKNNRQFPQSKVNKPTPKPTDKPPSDMEEFYKGPSKEVIEERKKAIDKIKRGNPTNEEIQEGLQDEDLRQGDYLEDPENPLNDLMKIGGAAAGFGGNILRMLINPLGGRQLAGAQDINTKMHILNSGMMVDENGLKYIWSPREQKFIDMGPYDPYYDGLPIPLGQRNSGMKIYGT